MNFDFIEKNYLKFILIGFLVLIILNLAVLDFSIFQSKDLGVEKNSLETPLLTKLTPVTQPPQNPNLILACPDSCVSQINQATASIKLNLPTAIPTQAFTPTPIPTIFSSSQSTSVVKEFFIPLGSGSSTASDWTDVGGVSVSIDSGQYGQIKSVTFEASVHIPTGNETAYVRLYNATDKHPVWYSDVSIEGGAAKLLISKSITLDAGNKLYQVQMKTSLQYQAVLDQARIHIATN